MTNLKAIAAGLLFCIAPTASIHAEITIDISKITCKEFLLTTILSPDNIAYWINGYYQGKRGNTVLTVAGLQDYITKVENFCISHREMTVMNAAQTILNSGK